MGAKSLSQILSVEQDQAKQFIESLINKFPGVKDFLSSSVDEAKLTESVRTLLGRRRLLPNINKAEDHKSKTTSCK